MALVLLDVTAFERQERRRERTNEHLGTFTGTAGRDLGTTIAVAKGHLEMAPPAARVDGS